MADRNALRLAVTLLFIGLLLAVLVQYLHSTIDGSVNNINNHPAEFIAIAASDTWTAVVLAQFIETALITAGLLALSSGLNLTAGSPVVINRLGAMAAVVSLALAGVIYAVAGVALKQAADAWVQAPAVEQAARFASAESLRWLQWGTTSYQTFMFSLALVLVATAIVWTARIPRPIGVAMGLQGIAYLVVGWDVGAEGLAFSGSLGVAYNLSSALFVIWLVWLLIVAWRMRKAVPAASG